MGNNLKREYVLILPSWYPSKLDEFNGDFNERLVKAVANYRTQVVIYVSTKRNSMLSETEVFHCGNIITYKVYFKNSKYDIVNILRMIKSYLLIFRQIFDKYGLPKLVHNYVFFPSGIITIYLKYRYGLKTVLTEHYSIFNYKNNPQNIHTHSLYKRVIYSLILKSFDVIISVSESLGASVSEWKKKGAKSHVLPNVVNVDFFNKKPDQDSCSGVFTLIHVSDMGPHKNVSGILKVFNKIVKDGISVKLILVGKVKEENLSFITDNNLTHHTEILGELPYQSVSKAMKRANSFILFSNYENMPCVILEALCCGLSIISSNVGGVATVVDKTNGILVESKNEVQLEEALISMIKNYHKYDTQLISEKAIKAFNYDVIGKKVSDIYTEILK